MKSLLVALTLILGSTALAQDWDWYVFGGSSVERNVLEYDFADSLMPTIGAGLQFNDNIGIEFSTQKLNSDDGWPTYSLVGGTFKFQIGESNISGLFKAGIGAWGDDLGDFLDAPGYVSAGILFDINEKHAFELSFSRVDEASRAFSINEEALFSTFNGYWRYKF